MHPMDGIVSIGAEFYGSISLPFASLETLIFSSMKEWEEWECKAVFSMSLISYYSRMSEAERSVRATSSLKGTKCS